MLDLRPYPSGLPDAALKAASYVMCVPNVGEANKSKDPSCLSKKNTRDTPMVNHSLKKTLHGYWWYLMAALMATYMLKIS